ncbi:MAG: 6-phosphofructokinase [Deltaproteobacteria bacterium RBG_13_49_15]|nr:MAG: 6-phosphofructokinase [Deltaproteobacteria bacterium RBG_13_49_15]
MRKIGILTSGGDAPGMNACIRAAVRISLSHKIEMIGIKWGFAGLIRGDMEPLDRRVVTNIIHQGGTILGTARCPEFQTEEGRALAIDILKRSGIEGLILIGGDGTFRGGTLLSKECDLSVIGVPGTIDNDVFGTDYTIGFDTAINTALNAIDHIRDTATAHDRLFFVEVMGRHTGFIAMESGIAGGVEELLIPEIPMSIEDLCLRLERNFRGGKKSAIVVVAETEQPGDSFRISKEIKDKAGFDSRDCILGHIQRGGSPTARDRVLASKLGAGAVRGLLEGKGGTMVGEIKGEIAYTLLKDTWEKKKRLHPDLENLAKIMSD